MLFQCDLSLEMNLFKGEYCSSLSSDDLLDPELPLLKMRAKGGTMALWKKIIDPYVTIVPSSTSSILSLVFSPPGLVPAILICLYLPTAGKDLEFVEEVTKLNDTILEMVVKYPDAMIFIRGDANANPKDTRRVDIVKKLCDDWSLTHTPINHPTYHHFQGGGLSDSQLDVLLHSVRATESLLEIICKLENPMVTSHHDALFSRFNLPCMACPSPPPHPPAAPRIENKRVKILWSESGIQAYQAVIAENLRRLRSNWLESSSKASITVLIQSTNAILDKFARETNNFCDLAAPPRQKSSKKPSYLISSERRVLKTFKDLKKTLPMTPEHSELILRHAGTRRLHNQLVRYARVQEGYTRDKLLNKICARNSTSTFKSIKSLRKSASSKIAKLHVGDKIFLGDRVPDGMYESIAALKTEPYSFPSNPNIPDFTKEYNYILDICKTGVKIPPLTKVKTRKILESIRKNVNDFFSITALHYIHAGEEGLEHFSLVLNSIIANVNIAGIQELNTIYACVLFKGHGKNRNLDRSYRTISTCPLAAKAIDIYVRELSMADWNKKQAPTQFQGEGMSHDLASLLLTETLQYSMNISKLPVFALFLDAKSAFDRVLKEILVRNLFIAGTDDHRLLYINERLSSRKTFCEFGRQMMGPISDVRGLEQGGVSSSDAYKIYNNEQATTSQLSKLGVRVRDTVISSVVLADDAVIVSNDINDLNNLLHLTIEYCTKYQVLLVPDKTKLLAFCKNEDDHRVRYAKLISPISLYEQKIEFSDKAEHLGIIRSSTPGNIPNLVERISAHRRALFSVLPAGMSLRHGGNPAAALRVEQLYALPVLLSGLAPLVLTKHETDMMDSHYKNMLSRLMKLHDRTPNSAVYFLAGSLPGLALLHLRQLSLFNMICHL